MQQTPKTVLVVDDDKTIHTLLAGILRKDYRIVAAVSGEEALEKASQAAPDVVLLDIMMPGIDGYETCRRMKSNGFCEHAQVIMVSARSSREEQMRAFEAGADDYVVKPFDPYELRSRIHLHFELQKALSNVAAVRAEIESHSLKYRQSAAERTKQIIATQDLAIFTMAKVAESRDEQTGEHLLRMRCVCQQIAEQLQRSGPYADRIDQEFLENLYRSSPLHDVGKVAIKDAILLKPGPLTPDEFEQMKRHTTLGADILDEAIAQSEYGGFLEMAAVIARYHHERFDGTGYPEGLSGTDIPLAARIVAVADVFDALISVRPYKPAYPRLDAVMMIEIESGRHFDPLIVDAFLAGVEGDLGQSLEFRFDEASETSSAAAGRNVAEPVGL